MNRLTLIGFITAFATLCVARPGRTACRRECDTEHKLCLRHVTGVAVIFDCLTMRNECVKCCYRDTYSRYKKRCQVYSIEFTKYHDEREDEALKKKKKKANIEDKDNYDDLFRDHNTEGDYINDNDDMYRDGNRVDGNDDAMMIVYDR